MDGVMEVITGRERRRRWSLADKLSIVAETREPGARIGNVAARHGVCESLVFTWRRQAREGVLVAPEMPVLVPVKMFETAGGGDSTIRFVSPAGSTAIGSDRDRTRQRPAGAGG